VEQELLTLPGQLSSAPVFFWPLYGLSFDLQLLITPFGIFKLFIEKPKEEIKNGQSRNTGSIWQKTQNEDKQSKNK
jgi:hypothetical protein